MPSVKISKELNSGIYFLTFTIKNRYYIFDSPRELACSPFQDVSKNHRIIKTKGTGYKPVLAGVCLAKDTKCLGYFILYTKIYV